MKTVGYLVGAALGFGGVVFLIASAQGNTLPRLIIGVVLMGVGVFVAVLARSKVPDQRIIQQIELSGDVTPEKLTCKACGAPLSRDSIAVKAGGIFVTCPYCQTSYQLEEEPKW